MMKLLLRPWPSRRKAWRCSAQVGKLPAKVARGYDHNVRIKKFKPDYWVWHKVVCVDQKTKFKPNWEGPYRAVKIVGEGSYKVEDKDGNAIANLGMHKTWVKFICECSSPGPNNKHLGPADLSFAFQKILMHFWFGQFYLGLFCFNFDVFQTNNQC